MSIIVMLDNRAETFPEGAYCALAYVNSAGPEHAPHAVVLAEEYVGRVLRLTERNGYDDSDFWATVWDDAKGEPRSFCYASTRGWSYPCYGSFVDATADTIAAYDAYTAAASAKAQADRAERQAKWDAATPAKGAAVRVIRGRKVAKGTEGRVFWFGQKHEFGPVYANGYKAAGIAARASARRDHFGDPREGMRVGIELADGSRVFIDAANVEVVAA